MRKNYDEEVEEKVEKIIRSLSYKVSNAEEKYIHDKNMLIHKINAKQYGLDELNTALKLISDIHQLSKEMYTTYEVVIVSLNDQCLAYENEGMSHRNLVHIVDFINKICKRYDQLTDGISLTIDYGDSHDVGNIDFYPSVVTLGIKNTWEIKLSLHQESAEEKEHIARKQKEAEKERQELQEKKNLEMAKLEKEKQAKLEEEKKIKEKEIEELKAKVAEWERTSECLKKEKEEKLQSITNENEKKFKELRCAMEKEYNQNAKEKKDLIDSSNKKKDELQLQLDQVGVFKFSLKRRLREEIQELANRIEMYEQEKKLLERTYQQKLAESFADESNTLQMEKNKIENKYIIPEHPEDAYKRKQEEECAKEEEKRKELEKKQKQRIERAKYSSLIRVVEEYSPYGCLVTDILRDPEFSSCSAVRISALLRQAIELDLIYKTISGGKSFFHVR